MADYTYEEKDGFDGKKVRVLGPDLRSGQARRVGRLERKLQTSDDRLAYLRTALRYWYSKDWFGSERRKQEA